MSESSSSRVVRRRSTFWPGPAALYDLLAQPLVASLPAGGTRAGPT